MQTISKATLQAKSIRKWAQNGQWGLEKDPTLSYWTINSTFVNLVFCFSPSMRKNLKWPPEGPKMDNTVWKGVDTYVFGHSHQLSQIKVFDPRGHS